MIWATVSSWSCFCWLYRASPSLAAKNIINLILVLTIWWCPCVESSLVLLEEDVCYDQYVLLGKLYYPLPCFIPYSKAKFACLVEFRELVMNREAWRPVIHGVAKSRTWLSDWTELNWTPVLFHIHTPHLQSSHSCFMTWCNFYTPIPLRHLLQGEKELGDKLPLTFEDPLS